MTMIPNQLKSIEAKEGLTGVKIVGGAMKGDKRRFRGHGCSDKE